MTQPDNRYDRRDPSAHAARGAPQVRPPEREPVSPFSANPYEALADTIDGQFHALQGRLTGGLSPVAVGLAYLDWVLHLANSPGKASELARNSAVKGAEFADYAWRGATDPEAPPYIRPLPQDRRFQGRAWQQWPFNVLHQSFLLTEQWWRYATTGVRGMRPHHQDLVSFTARQALDVFAPSNFPWTNPEIIQRTREEGGNNLRRGAENLLQDLARYATREGPPGAEAYRVGETVATSEGKVVYRNRLMELIQYAPLTETVHPEPVLMVPAWIMKYYILDLSPHNSLVRYLREQGYTVFMISWHNPDAADEDIGLGDYRNLGVFEALDAVGAICPGRRVHGVGYCLGGTLLSIAAAAMARDGDERFADLTLFAAQTDFREAGEIMHFVDESQVAYLEDVMREKGFLDARQMAGAFRMLRSNDLIWSQAVQSYLLGESGHMNDLMAWNVDATRMPRRMHAEYLRRLFLHNDLANNRYLVDGRPISLGDIRVPIFAVGTVKDHIAPWQSVFKIHHLSASEVTFVLTSGGHNAGIVSEPGHPRRRFQIATHRPEERYAEPQEWLELAPQHDGSWWPAWAEWLTERCGPPTAPPPLGLEDGPYRPIEDAPGSYVRET